ncbi:hypothetical protein Taro_042960 [Colocasia esculenta]|uniref:Chalcone/stilbene synthase C-terminal domain-containing protein n=1 Tax=Colocasia esculenta TaxID=4460 RepID=A0A843WF73_COLES|nr:hypothetical protein [Colocasia esculenta]
MLFSFGYSDGIMGLRIAKDITENNPGSHGTKLGEQSLTRTNVGTKRSLLELLHAAVPEGGNRGRVIEEGITLGLGRGSPKVERHVEEFCRGAGEAKHSGRVRAWELFWAAHPGEPTIVRKVEGRLGLSEGMLGASRRQRER